MRNFLSSTILACLLSAHQASAIDPFSLPENEGKDVIHRPSGFSVKMTKHADHLSPESINKSMNRRYRLGSSILGEDYKP